MPDQPNNTGPKKDRSLSEISHLFLSSVRDRHTNGAPRPVRKPPQPQQQNPMPNPNVSIDMTPEEFARQYGTGGQPAVAGAPSIDSNNIDPPQVSAIIGAHLNGKLFDRVKEYASHLCGTFARVGLIEVDAAELRLMLFERQSVGESITPAGTGDGFFRIKPEEFDLKRINEALEELSWDVEQWLLLLPNPRSLQSQALLRQVDHWVLLSTCDHDGLVSGYRTLKGMTEIQDAKPTLSLALLDATNDAHAEKVYQKLASVSQQFLHWPMEAEPPVRRRENVAEHLVLLSRAGKDAAAIQTQGMNAPQWQAVSSFLNRGKRHDVVVDRTPAAPTSMPANANTTTNTTDSYYEDVQMSQSAPALSPATLNQPKAKPVPSAPRVQPAAAPKQHVADVVIGQKSQAATTADVAQPPSVVIRPRSATADAGGATATALTAMPTQPAPSLPPREHVAFAAAAAAAAAPALAASIPMPAMSLAPASREDDVVELPAGPLTSGVIIGAVMRSVAGEYIECPLKPPMNADASIAVGRDRRLVIVAVAQQGLSDLRAIGRAYQWLTENRALVAMAVPQLSIDAMQMPRLQLLVDQQDLTAEILQPMLQSGNVTVQAYRKLKWAGRTGLLLNAA